MTTNAAATSSSPRKPAPKKSNLKPNPKTEALINAAKLREKQQRALDAWQKMVDQAIYKIEYSLIDNPSVSEKYLKIVSQLLQSKHIDEVVSERNLGLKCGNPLCATKIPSAMEVLEQDKKEGRGRFKIDLKNKKVYDRHGNLYNRYCSDDCHRYVASFKQDYMSNEVPHARTITSSSLRLIKMIFPNVSTEQLQKLKEDIETTIATPNPSFTLAMKVKEKKMPQFLYDKESSNTTAETTEQVKPTTTTTVSTKKETEKVPEPITKKPAAKQPLEVKERVYTEPTVIKPPTAGAAEAIEGYTPIFEQKPKKTVHWQDGSQTTPEASESSTTTEAAKKELQETNGEGSNTPKTSEEQARLEEVRKKSVEHMERMMQFFRGMDLSDDEEEVEGERHEEEGSGTDTEDEDEEKLYGLQLSLYGRLINTVVPWITNNTLIFLSENAAEEQKEVATAIKQSISQDKAMSIFQELLSSEMDIDISEDVQQLKEEANKKAQQEVKSVKIKLRNNKVIEPVEIVVDEASFQRFGVIKDQLMQQLRSTCTELRISNTSCVAEELDALLRTFQYTKAVPALAQRQWKALLYVLIAALTYRNEVIRKEVNMDLLQRTLATYLELNGHELNLLLDALINGF